MRLSVLLFIFLYVVVIGIVGMAVYGAFPPADGSYTEFWKAFGTILAAITGVFTLASTLWANSAIEKQRKVFAQELEKDKSKFAEELARKLAALNNDLARELELQKSTIGQEATAHLTILSSATKATYAVKRLEAGDFTDQDARDAEDLMTTALPYRRFMSEKGQRLWMDIFQQLRFIRESVREKRLVKAEQTAFWRKYVETNPRHIGVCFAELEAHLAPPEPASSSAIVRNHFPHQSSETQVLAKPKGCDSPTKSV